MHLYEEEGFLGRRVGCFALKLKTMRSTVIFYRGTSRVCEAAMLLLLAEPDSLPLLGGFTIYHRVLRSFLFDHLSCGFMSGQFIEVWRCFSGGAVSILVDRFMCSGDLVVGFAGSFFYLPLSCLSFVDMIISWRSGAVYWQNIWTLDANFCHFVS